MKCKILNAEQAKAALQELLSPENPNNSELYELDMDNKKLYLAEQLSIKTLRDDLEDDGYVLRRVHPYNG